MKKRNKPFFTILSLVAAGTLLLTACGSKATNGTADSKEASATNEAKQVYELTVNDFTSSTGHVATEVFIPWKKLVEEKTKGRVKVNLYHGAALGGSQTVMKDIKGGVYDVGMAYSSYYMDSDLYPVTIGDLPFAPAPEVKTNVKIMNEYMKKYQDAIFKDVILMGISTGSPSYFHSRTPITKLEDLKGKKVRVSTKSEAELIKEWGAVPVSVKLEELYDAMQKGIVDVITASTPQHRDMHLAEVAPYFIEIPYKVIEVMPVMNKGFYDKLPDDLKKLFKEELNPAITDLITKDSTNIPAQALKTVMEQINTKGGQYIKIAPEEMKRFKATAKPIWEAWVQDANKRGLPGEQMMNEYKDLLKKEGVEVPF